MLSLLVASSGLLVSPGIHSAIRYSPIQSARMAAGDSTLIIQNKGGGHGESESGKGPLIGPAFPPASHVCASACIALLPRHALTLMLLAAVGLHLALELAKKDTAVTIIHEGKDTGKPPHTSYGALEAAGVTVKWCGDLTDASAALESLDGASFTAVVDNWSKSPEQIKPYAEAAKAWGASYILHLTLHTSHVYYILTCCRYAEAAKAWGVSNYAYVSSAGMYTPEKGEYPSSRVEVV